MATIDWAFNMEDISYLIKEEDTIESICERFDTSPSYLARHNGMSEAQMRDYITVNDGSVIIIPMVGDISLGAAKVDDEDRLLYYHKDGTINTEAYREGTSGKLIKDLAYVYDRDALKQIIMNRLKTDSPDWYHHPNMAGNLSDLIGEPNTRATGDQAATSVFNALTYDGLFVSSQINVKPVPINPEEIMIVITALIDGEEPYRLPLIFNLTHGLKIM